MKITYDEYVATWQSKEAKVSLDERMSNDSEKRYAQRIQGAGTEQSSRDLLANMSQEEFKSLRKYQMMQLLQAYRESRSGNTHNLLSINPGTTNPDEVRRVVGPKSGYVYNSGALALDYETIIAVNHIASLIGNSQLNLADKSWENEITMTPSILERVVDEMIAVKGILTENVKLESQDLVGDKVYRETNIAKRAIGKSLIPEKGMNLPDGTIIEYESDNMPKVGRNCFGIQDFELSWDKLMERKSNALVTAKRNLISFIDKKINPNAERNNQDRIGNKTFEYETGGER